MKDFSARGKLLAVLFALTTMLGCGGLDAGTPAAQSNPGLAPSSAVVDFGSVPVGTAQTRSNTITNNTKSAVVITGIQVASSDFKVSGQKLPMTLAPGAHVTLQITYSPQSGGNSQSSIVLASNVNRFFSTFTLKGTAVLGSRLRLNPTSISFGSVQIGKTQTLSATLSNSGAVAVTVTRAAIAGKGFTLTGLTLPHTLKAGDSASFNVSFAPAAGGAASGMISVFGTVSLNAPKRPLTFGDRTGQFTTVALNTISTSLTVPVSGTGTGATSGTGSGQLTVSPSVLALGVVKLGATRTQSATFINSGTSQLTIRQATVTGRGFRMSGISFPLTLAAGQRQGFTVTFTPQAAGTATGNIAVTTDDSSVSVPVSADATAAGALISNPSSLSFGSVQAAQGQILSAALTNSGSSNVTVSQANISGAGFSLNGLSLPVTLAAGQSVPYSVTFKPQSTNAVSGALSFISDAVNTMLSVPLVANAAAVGVLSTSDSSLNFGGVQINATGTQPETLTNSGGANVTITQANVAGKGFRITGLNLPLTLNPGQSFTFGAAFNPASGGNFTGSISIISDASDSNVTITLAGTATVSGQLAVSPATLNFGSVMVGQSKSLPASLTANGSSITVSNAGMSTSEFTISGLALPITLASGQSTSFTVTFKPQASGAATASGSYNSNAAASSVAQALSGTGTPAPQHSVALSWNPSSSTVVGYNVYRGSVSGGPYSKINAMNPGTTYTDSTVQSGQTYFYVTTAVDGSGNESANSNQTQAVIPTP